ncbi:uncharacterized protein LOC128861508 [Anastrepha ludens]|uniref:uncharacterized protein LOC128861508 n=1 Tax=Anastrepha ludens TaxID=28586 RepID=UPI0023B06B3A|nr:uncharacterized protein LOC128861508 [Anastrepha ludens]
MVHSCCIWTGVFILTTVTHGAPQEQRHQSDDTSQRLRRQIFPSDFGANSDPLFFPAPNIFNINPFARPQFNRPGPGQPLIFSNEGQQTPSQTTTPRTQQSSNIGDSDVVFINNRPMVATMAPFTARTTASPQFLNCFGSCPTTSEYNPVCASNQQQYQNQQKFDCARRCGADIQIVRRGSCEGLFPMQRG